MLSGRHRAVFSKRPVFRPPVRAEEAGRNKRLRRGWREAPSVYGWRHPVCALEARRKGADATKADTCADFRHRAVGAPQHRRSALEPAREQVRVRRLAESAPELAAEVTAREASGTSKIIDTQRLEVAGVREISCAQEMPDRGDGTHSAPVCAPPDAACIGLRAIVLPHRSFSLAWLGVVTELAIRRSWCAHSTASVSGRRTRYRAAAARHPVTKADNEGWSLYGAQRSQPVATGGKSDTAENGSDERNPLPWVAMVRRGSTVRVRQRASSFACLADAFVVYAGGGRRL
jgi:hypothetical protein